MKDSEKIIPVIRRCLAGDAAAQEELILAAQSKVYYYCKRMLKQEEDAQDATQEVLISMLTKLDRLQQPEAFWGWLSAIAVNYCRNLVSRDRRESQIPEDEEGNSLLDAFETSDEQTVPDKALDNDETRRMIVGLVDDLPDAQRQCVLLFYYQEMSVRDIAATLDTSEGTVKSRLNYARRSIRQGVERYAAQGVRLYSFSPVPLLAYFLQKDALLDGLNGAAAQAMAHTVLAAAGGTAAAAAGTAAASAGAQTAGAAAGGSAASAGTAVSHAVGGIVAHKGALTLAGVVLAGAVAGGVALHQPPPQTPPDPDPAVEVVEPLPESEPQPAEETVPEPEVEPVVEPEPQPVVETAAEPEPQPVVEPEPAQPQPEAGLWIWPSALTIYPNSSYPMKAMNPLTGEEINDGTVTWSTQTPELASVSSAGQAHFGGEGTAYLTASWNGYTAQAKVNIVPQDDQIWCSVAASALDVGDQQSTTLYQEIAERHGTAYTVE